MPRQMGKDFPSVGGTGTRAAVWTVDILEDISQSTWTGSMYVFLWTTDIINR